LSRSFASFIAGHAAPAVAISEFYGVTRRSAVGARRDWFRALHAAEKGILPYPPLQWLCLILFDYAGHLTVARASPCEGNWLRGGAGIAEKVERISREIKQWDATAI